MSGKRSRAQRDHRPPNQSEGLWVRSEWLPGAVSYVLGLSLDADLAWTLTPDEGGQYARAALAAAETAAFDAAAARLLHEKLHLEQHAVAQFLVQDLRPDRPPLPVAPGPITFVPCVSAASGRPFIRMDVLGQPHSQVDAEPLRQHALAVLSAITVADLDAGLRRTLVTMGIEGPRAEHVIDDLRNWRVA